MTTREAKERTALTLARPVAMLHPQAIAISGPTPLPSLHEAIVAAVNAGIRERATPATADAVREIYITSSRWTDVDDNVDRLAVPSGAIQRARDFFAYEDAWDQLAPDPIRKQRDAALLAKSSGNGHSGPSTTATVDSP